MYCKWLIYGTHNDYVYCMHILYKRCLAIEVNLSCFSFYKVVLFVYVGTECFQINTVDAFGNSMPAM